MDVTYSFELETDVVYPLTDVNIGFKLKRICDICSWPVIFFLLLCTHAYTEKSHNAQRNDLAQTKPNDINHTQYSILNTFIKKIIIYEELTSRRPKSRSTGQRTHCCTAAPSHCRTVASLHHLNDNHKHPEPPHHKTQTEMEETNKRI